MYSYDIFCTQLLFCYRLITVHVLPAYSPHIYTDAYTFYMCSTTSKLRAYVLRPIRRAEQKNNQSERYGERRENKFKSRDYNTMKQCIEHKSIYIRIVHIYIYISVPIY